ncbi:hypothetical protein PALB_18140 [Pseudoalteromonas luteoviolacea B = ATCC 29581]|nr:hypothetical protein PALB_18140 [Pseudoalteromonas luteoviolacea B = ATCC 29581]
MYINYLLLLHGQRVMCVFFTAALILFLSSASASPGAHGPNGEHLDTAEKASISAIPKFESFTETFEVVGELRDSKLVIYLHDFKSNSPVENASIEVDAMDQQVKAQFSKEAGAYLVTEPTLIEQLNQAGSYELILTVLSDDAGDLLVANLTNNILNHAVESNKDHHHDFPWSSLLVAIVAFVFGVLVARTFGGQK